jgi:hypothetical protein
MRMEILWMPQKVIHLIYIYVLDVVGPFKWLLLSKFILIFQLIFLDLSSF